MQRGRSPLFAWLASALLVLGLGGPTAARAQGYPDKPLHLIVPLGAGSITDIIARMVATRLSERLKLPVVAENKTGAGGIVALRALQSAAPDGYTFGLVQSGSTIQPWTLKDFPFDVRKDFQLMSLMYAGPLMLVVPPDLPAQNVSEYLALMKAQPQKAFYGSSGIGTTTHLAVELLMQSASVNMTHVPFKGSADVYTAMLSGNVNAYFDLYGTAKPLLDAGRVKVIGVASRNRMVVLPNVAPIADVVPDFEVTGWTAFAVPNGTPKTIADKLTAELRAVMQEPDFQQRLKAMGVEPGGNSPEEIARYVAREYEKWGRVTKAAGIKAQ